MHFVCISLDSNAGVVLNGEEVVYDLEPLAAGRVVSAGDVHAGAELRLGVVSEEGQGGDDGVRGDVEGELVFDYAELLDEFGEACSISRAKWRSSWSVWVSARGSFGVPRLGACASCVCRAGEHTRSNIASKVVQRASDIFVVVNRVHPRRL